LVVLKSDIGVALCRLVRFTVACSCHRALLVSSCLQSNDMFDDCIKRLMLILVT